MELAKLLVQVFNDIARTLDGWLTYCCSLQWLTIVPYHDHETRESPKHVAVNERCIGDIVFFWVNGTLIQCKKLLKFEARDISYLM